MRKKLVLVFVFGFIFIGLLVRNYLLRSVLFLDWDEGMYAQIATEMMKNKTLVTTFNNQLWFDKPPFSHLLVSFSFLIYRSEFTARFTMVVVAWILLILLFLHAKKVALSLFPKQKPNEIIIASLIPVLVLAASPIFLERATMLNSDLLVALSWLGYFLLLENYWSKLLFLTLGVYAKSILGFYPLIFDFFLLFFKKIKITSNNIFKVLLIILIPCLWYVFGILKFGWFFIENHFLSQMLKRLYVPIELHFGGKFFYLSYLWQTLGFINILFLIGYCLIFFDLAKEIKKIKQYIVFLVPLPFFILLTIMKTKISWYVVIFLPFVCLTLSYLYLKIKNKYVKVFLFGGLLIFFFINFPRQTLFIGSVEPAPEKLVLAKCLHRFGGKNLGFLVDEQERKNRNFLEAAHYQTTSSFFYGGSPSFVYYLEKPVTFFYDLEEFQKKYKNFAMITLSKKDIKTLKINVEKNNLICPSENWVSFTN